MIELREVRARKISSPSSSLIFPPSRQKNRKTAIRGKRKNRNAKNTEIRVLVGVRHYMQATVGEYWDSWFSSISCSSQALFPRKNKTRKKTKKHTRKYRKKEHTRNKQIPSAFLSTSSSSSPSQSEVRAIHVELVKSRKAQPECTRERARCAAKGTRRLRSLSL
jgi:hypothetical protein